VISVAEARDRIASAFTTVGNETVAIADAGARVLGEDVKARLSQPPEPVSSMDGYALRAADAKASGARLKQIGSAPAGHPFRGRVGEGETVRIFTGGVVPDGADAILIQEDATAEGDTIIANAGAIVGKHIRVAGLDFKQGDVLVRVGTRVSARDLSLLASADVATVSVRRKPRVSFAATGDELSRPGEPRKPGGIVASSGYSLAALIRQWGGEPADLGILPDNENAIAGIAERARDTDLIVTMGGASVGDHDLVQRALGPKGFTLDFWKIAMRPGKPLIFGRLGKTPLLGLPGNPVSTLVCALLFLKPAIAALLGTEFREETIRARLSGTLKQNDTRQDYIRAQLSLKDGTYWAEPFAVQDSSMLSTFARSDGLIVRAPHAPAVAQGEAVDVLPLGD
jgi:molybdopterin molybdotransferase